jgi:ABC-type nickel/cobalt efflux system permease component RcnA/Tol biopolymer transport system component
MGKTIRAVLISLLLAVLLVQPGAAHPADMYFHTHRVRIMPEGLEVHWELIPGPLIAQSIWYSADSDQDQDISPSEYFDWASSIVQTFSSELDDYPLELSLISVTWPESLEELYSGNESIQIYLEGSWPSGSEGIGQLVLRNRFNPKNSISWYEIRAEEGVRFDTPVQNSGTISLDIGISDNGEYPKNLDFWESGTPSLPWVVESVGLGELAEEAAAESQAPPGGGSRPAAILEGLMQQNESSFTFIFSAIALAALLGALHALSPGHGKTIVAAYLVGSQGKFYHAVALGGIVTLTHTGSVFALGLITLSASRYFLAADVFPFLELLSGLLILVLGIGLLYPRLRLWILEINKRRSSGQKMNVDSGEKGEKLLVIDQKIEEPGPAHSHDPSQMGAIPRGPAVGDPLQGIRWRSLIPLAISGGLVPCPDAIAILLIAATINRLAFGLSLIVSFSLGLAVVLIVIGILIVQGKRLFARLRWFNRAALIVPIISALIVLSVGVLLSVNAIRNINPAQLSFGMTEQKPSFDIRDAKYLYTALNEENHSLLFQRSIDDADIRSIDDDANIWSYSLAPDQTSLIYATNSGENDTQLWEWDPDRDQSELLIECQNAYCSDITWSPDSRGILYGRLDFDLTLNPANVQSIWWLDLTTGETAPLFQDPLTPGFNPRWSPDGKRLSYSSINPLEIRIYEIESGDSLSLPTQLGYPGTWSPDGKKLLILDIDQENDSFVNKIYSYDLENNWLTALAIDPRYDDSFPAWSPDGEWIALVRREWSEDTPGRGNQLWVMRPDGSDLRQLTDAEGEIYFGQPVWSPDSRYLLYDFRQIDSAGVITGIKFFDLNKGKEVELVSPGSRPTWMP